MHQKIFVKKENLPFGVVGVVVGFGVVARKDSQKLLCSLQILLVSAPGMHWAQIQLFW
jgi:hypothetical protein